jgi:hypothetical protein
MSLGPSGEIKAKNATLTSAEWDAEKSNKEYNDAMKRGEAVSINDPSIDPLTRKLVMGSFGSTSGPGSKDVFGDIEDITVPKGYKATSYKDIYGGDFNPDEFRGAAKAGKLDQYMKDKGYKEGQSWSPNFGSYTKYKTKPPVSEKAPMEKMPTMKTTKIVTGGSLKQPKTKSTTTSGWFGDYVPSTEGASNKQLKQFASYASKTNLGESFIASPKSAIDQYKGEMKSQRREYAKEGNKAGVKATTADIRQARSAAKFTGSKNPLDVPGMATGYRAAQDNAANRNTIKAQVSNLKKLR